MPRKSPRFDGTFFMYDDTDPPELVGYLFDSGANGIYSPDGKVEATPDQLKLHNEHLTQAMIDGLDTRCQIGQGGTFYLKEDGPKTLVTAWTGEVVSCDVTRNGNSLTFRRKGMTFRGRIGQDAAFNFRRVS